MTSKDFINFSTDFRAWNHWSIYYIKQICVCIIYILSFDFISDDIFLSLEAFKRNLYNKFSFERLSDPNSSH